VLLDELNVEAHQNSPRLRGDWIVFSSFRSGNEDVFAARRAGKGAPFADIVPVDELNSPAADGDVWLSPDLNYAVFASDRGGDYALYETWR
jgi:hypothetical protein